MKPEILIPTCDKYIHMVEATMITCRELWPAGYTFRILGYKEPLFKLDENWHFHKMHSFDEGPEIWSVDLQQFLSQYPHSHFIYGNDDCALTFMNFRLLETAIRIMENWDLVGRFALMADHKDGPFHESADPLVKTFSYKMNYRLSLGWSIYNKKMFLQYLQPGMTPWEYEKQSCGDVDTSDWAVSGFTPKAAIDAAFFARKNKGIIEDWDKGYFGHDLTGDMRERVKKIIFKEL